MTTDLRLAAGTRLPEDGWSDRDRAQAQLVQRRCYLGVSLVGALAHGLVQADQRGEVLAVGEPAGPGRAAEAVRHRGRDPAQHDVLVLPACGAVAFDRPEDVPARGQRRPGGERRAGRKRRVERSGLPAAFARGLVIRHGFLALIYVAI